MRIREAEAVMSVLESTQCPFDNAKVDYYRSKAQDFVERKHAFYPGHPVLLDVSFGRTKLPTRLSDRIEKWMTDHPRYSPFIRTFARNYLISLLDDACDGTLDAPLAECVLAGGDFYLETGMLYLRDAAAVMTIHYQKENSSDH
jgi:hypothetical protein